MKNLKNRNTGRFLGTVEGGRYLDVDDAEDALILTDEEVAAWHKRHGHQYEAVKAAKEKKSR